MWRISTEPELQSVNISHDFIHRILKGNGLATSKYSKSRRRKWVKYERKHTNSLWQADYYMVEDQRRRAKRSIGYIVDVSRMITRYRLLDKAMTRNALLVPCEAIKRWGSLQPYIMTDHGSPLYAKYSEGKSP